MNQEDKEKLNKECPSGQESPCAAGVCQCSQKNVAPSQYVNASEAQKNDACCENEAKLQEASNKIKRLEDENKALTDKVKLAQAELINYRRRKDEETANLLKYANQSLIMELINLVDNFERAIKLDDNDLTDELSKFLAGFKMMYSSLTDTLKKFGVEEINRVGEIFDPTQEQALLTDHVDGKQDEEVIEVLLKGYKLKDRVIRPASVKINQN